MPTFIAVLLLLTSVTAALTLPATSQAETKYAISGYILDEDGNGLANAEIIFGVPDIVPAAFSDANGHYVIYAPAGTYHLNVWPPFDSNYIFYDQKGFTVNGDTAKNITLSLGCKVSGYILNNGVPVQGAVVALGSYYCGWYSNYSGYYFVTAPAGTYTFSVHPRTGLTFPSYTENNLAVTHDFSKNVSLSSNTPTQRVKVSGYVLDSEGNGIAGANVIFNVPSIVPSVWTNQYGYYEIYAPAGTYHINVWPPFDSNYINYDEPGFTVTTSNITKNMTLGVGYKVSGYILDAQGAPVSGASVLLNNYGSGWYSKSNGYYFLNVPAGTYTITAKPGVGAIFPVYQESNFAVTADTAKNITVGSTNANPTSSPTSGPSGGYVINPTQSPTPSTSSADSVASMVDTSQETTENPTPPAQTPADFSAVLATVAVGVALAIAAIAIMLKKHRP